MCVCVYGHCDFMSPTVVSPSQFCNITQLRRLNDDLQPIQTLLFP